MFFKNIIISNTIKKGRGVFTNEDIPLGTIIENSPVIVMSMEDRALLDKTLLHNYIFEWGNKKNKCCMALGYVSMYNHSFESNCEYEMDYADETISIKAVRNIKVGEELCINYNGNWNDKKTLWFEVE